MILKINALPIKESGVDKEGDPFVVLDNGTIFYGNKTRTKIDKFLYKSLSSSTQKKLSLESMHVALDIMIRYVEGGLMYGGPKKQSRYKVKEGDFVSEMGAYQGFCSVKLAQQVGPTGQVVCIEPMPDNYRLLCKNMKANKLNHVVCINKGVWDSSIELKFNRRKGDGQSSSIEMTYDNSDEYKVPADTLDNIFGEINSHAKDFMIIQLNGAEINGLRGLNSFKPKYVSIAARYDTEGEDAAIAIKKELEKRNYKVEIDEEDFVFGELIK